MVNYQFFHRILLFALTALMPLSLSAATITVTNLNDSGPGSLRQAIIDAMPSDTIDFQTSLVGTITLTSGELSINKSLVIYGPWNTNITVSGNNATRVFHIVSGTVNLSLLTISSGYEGPATAIGGGILNEGTLWGFNLRISGNSVEGNVSSSSSGGGIYNSGELHLQDCTIDGNFATSPGGTASGGGIYCHTGAVTEISRSAISNNSASGQMVFGGGCSLNASGTGYSELSNCTISSNAIAAAGNGFGGGIHENSDVTLIHCTIANNTSDTSFGGVFAGSPLGVTLQNTIIANNNASVSPDVGGNFNSLDYNLIGDPSGAAISGSTLNNITGTDPQLGPLADNGGSTLTHAILPTSPALDVIPPGSCVEYTDQRGVIRPKHDMCEIGAYEKSYFIAGNVHSSGISPTNADDIGFSVGFNDLAYNFDDESDLIIYETGSVSHTGVTVSMGGMNFIVTVNGVTGDGELSLAVSTTSNVQTQYGDPLEYSVVSDVVIIDNTGPYIEISPPSPLSTTTGPVDFTITYTDAASINLTETDVILNTTGDVIGTVSVNGSGLTERTVTISAITGNGTLSISISPGSAEDSPGNLSEAAGPSAACIVGMPVVPIASWTVWMMMIGLGIIIVNRVR